MNQGRFRLVFSGLHGMMMAVAEFVSAQGKAEAAGDRSAPASAHESSDTPWFATRKCAFAALQRLCVLDKEGGNDQMEIEFLVDLYVLPESVRMKFSLGDFMKTIESAKSDLAKCI